MIDDTNPMIMVGQIYETQQGPLFLIKRKEGGRLRGQKISRQILKPFVPTITLGRYDLLLPPATRDVEDILKKQNFSPSYANLKPIRFVPDRPRNLKGRWIYIHHFHGRHPSTK